MKLVDFRRIYKENNNEVRLIMDKLIHFKIVKSSIKHYLPTIDVNIYTIKELKNIILLTLEDEKLEEVFELNTQLKRINEIGG